MRARAELQAGCIAAFQLKALGVPDGTRQGWKRTGDLQQVLPKVYAFGHRQAGILAEMWIAILYAGPGAMLSHLSAAWWRRLIEFPPPKPEVSTPKRVKQVEGVTVYTRRELDRVSHRDLPITTVPQTMLDLASTGRTRLVRKALGRLEFQRAFDLTALRAIAEPYHRPGSVLLNQCLDIHDPRFAQTNSELEEDFFLMWEARRGPVYEVGTWIHGIECDCWWPAERVVVQLDGERNHGPWVKRKADYANDLTLRGDGIEVRRYNYSQVNDTPDQVYRDVIAVLASRRG